MVCLSGHRYRNWVGRVGNNNSPTILDEGWGYVTPNSNHNVIKITIWD